MENEDRIIIIDHIKNGCRRKCVLPIVTIVILVAILFIVPFGSILNPEKINDIYNVKPNQKYVKATASNLEYTGYDLKNGIGKKFSYYYSMKKGKCFFVLIPAKKIPKSKINKITFKAKVIKPNSAYNDMVSLFSKDINWTEEGLKSISTGYIVSAADYHPYRSILFLVLILFLICAALVKLIIAIRGYRDPYSYPVCSYLSKNENLELIDEAQEELDSENYLQINATYITENYFIDLDTSGTRIIPLKDVIWVFRFGRRGFDIRKHALTYTINFITRDEELVKIPRKSSDEAMAIMKSIKATEYDIITGHSDEKRRRVLEILRNSGEEEKTEDK